MKDMTTKKRLPDSERGLLRDVVVSRVQPSSISEHPEFLYPTAYDIPYMDIYVPTVSLYKLDTTDPSALSTFIHGVKNSLSQVLSVYYPMAGKWIVTQDAWIRKLFCNDEGAVFVRAAIDEEMDKVIDRNELQIPDELTGEHAVPGFLSAFLHKNSNTNEFPALLVQVTSFKCGGVALALNFNHMTVDGYGFNRFLKAWSEIASTGRTSSKPHFDRSVVVSHLDKNDILGFPPHSTNQDDTLSSYFRSFNPDHHSKLTSKLFSIRNVTVERLRQETNEGIVSDMPEGPERFTTFDCVSAQIWRSSSRIPKILSNSGITGYDRIQILIPVEGRSRWCNPSVPEDFVGNMCLHGAPEFPSSEVTQKPLSFAASHIHQSVRKVNHKTSGEILDRMMKSIKESKLAKENLATKNPDNEATTYEVHITAWSRFDSFYDLDFGYGGPYFAFPCGNWLSPATAVFLLPPAPKSDNALEMLIRGHVEVVNALCQETEFIDLVS